MIPIQLRLSFQISLNYEQSDVIIQSIIRCFLRCTMSQLNQQKILITQMKKIILIAGGLTISALAYFSLNKQTQITTAEEDEKVIAFYKQLISQSFPHFYLVSDIIRKLKVEAKNDFETGYQAILKEVESLFKKKQLMVLKQFNIQLEDVIRIKSNSKNQDLKQTFETFQQLYEDALQGSHPKFDMTEATIERFNHKELLKITQETLLITVESMKMAISQMDQIKGRQEQFLLDDHLCLELLNKTKLVQRRRQIYCNHGLDQYEIEPSSPTQTYTKLINYHKQNDNRFSSAITCLDDKYEQIISKFMRRLIKQEDIDSELKKISLQEILATYL
ncbi:hypothetical protein pb186bvf_004576 [Paramecium bursaria]